MSPPFGFDPVARVNSSNIITSEKSRQLVDPPHGATCF
ncbi:hypothetical protein NK6_9683 [Bradyrhizobium diazoefficiens]|uniref:Uncharacterized protein n=1 Tax=Bradyrhizobium diazoefficiens TaxID=1355477 RepID=A0A0E4BY08_9BRAD|nr:hypothetical protein NK6_9683 [Bradyrhizobium diazoefficiens]